MNFSLPHETPGNRAGTQQSLAREAQKLFGADFCAVQSVNPVTQLFHGDAVTAGNLPAEAPPDLQQQLNAFSQRAIAHAKLYVENRERRSQTIQSETVFRGFETVAGVPFFTKREIKPMAVLILGFRKNRKLKKLEKDVLKLFTDQWLPVLETVWLLGRYREVVKIGQDINQTLEEPRELFEHVFTNISKILDTKYFFMLGVYHQSNKTIDYHMAFEGTIEHWLDQSMDLETLPDGRYKSGCAYAIAKKEKFVELYRSQNKEPLAEFYPLMADDQPDPESLVFVPLMFRDEPLGALTIQHLRPNAFDDEDIHILTLLANQISLAISDMRLFSYLEALNQEAQQLTRGISSDSMLPTLVERIRIATKADLVTLYPYVENSDLPLEERFSAPLASGELLHGILQKASRPDDIAWLALKRDEPVWAEDSTTLFAQLSDGAHARQGDFERREQIASTVALSLRVEGEPVGVLFVNYRHPQDFKAPQKNFINGLANFAAIAIYNNRKFQDLNRHRFAELEAFRQIDVDISKSLKLQDVLASILTTASKTVRADAASIYLFNEHTNRLETEVSFGIEKSKFARHKLSPDDQGLVPWVFRNKRAIRVNNVKNDPKWKDVYFPLLEKTLSEMDVPLRKDESEMIGVISFESERESAFSEGNVAFLVTLAGQAVLAIKQARLYEEADEGRRSLEILHEVTKEIIAQGGDPEKVIRFILSQARRLIGAEGALFQQYDGETPVQYYVDSSDYETQNSLIELSGAYELGIVKHVATTKEPYTTIGVDAQEDPYYKGSGAIHSETAVPLLAEDDRIIGVLDLESPRQYAFDERDERILNLFGELAVVAIKNARDYTRATEEAKRFLLLSQAGSELGEIIEPSHLENAYNVVIAKVGEFSGGEVVIRRYDPFTEELRVAAVGHERATMPLATIKKSQGINGQVARDMTTIRVDNLDAPPPEVAKSIGDDSTIKTLIVTPLLFEKSYYGNLVLSDIKPNCFSDADEDLLEGLAKQLAITIHRLEIAKEKEDFEREVRSHKIMSEVGQSAMEIAHRLGQELKPVDVYLGRIRTVMKNEQISHPKIDAELERVANDVSRLIHMAKGLRSKITKLEDLAHERTIIPVKDLLAEADPSLHAPENLNMAHEIQDDLPNVHVVPGQIIDILRNLFTNAVEAMPDGGNITIRAVHDPLGKERRKEFVEIEVEDNGPGIKREDQHKVFDLFYSTKASSGFGLWSSRQYARANGGDLELQSTFGTGTIFTLSLPIAITPEPVQ
ncbi:MAG TPA: GAF domain-containing protein [Pyrinomonadaceae bacterium]|nr:GAF domain-containing protein [Pyrinomonadaceae bacterium]